MAKRTKTKSKLSILEQDKTGYERYFEDHHMKTRTSNNTLTGVGVLDKAECINILTKIPVKHKTEIEMLSNLYKCQFLQWYIELKSGFNLLFYGYGSKKQLLEEFSDAYLKDRPLLVINGFLSKLKIKEIFIQVISGINMGVKPKSRETLEELTEIIKEYFSDPDRSVQCLYIMIHNIDGQGLRTLQIQNCLSILASCPNIYFIASTDHINATLLFDQDRATKFNWIWHDVTTFNHYEVEPTFEDSPKVKRRKQQELNIKVVQSVLSTWNANRRRMFEILAKHQIQANLLQQQRKSRQGKGGALKSEDIGMEHDAFYKACRTDFCIRTDGDFNKFLSDFRNHEIIQSLQSKNGKNIYFIPMEAEDLKKVLEQC
ncbi:20182_t:CDS:1 [Cetraspora pellucida]|uniref:Origin recognition complex subunit 2 n=1 Tax=Cetraspora pellucida TaxID=1433469 RepID=A0A9N9BC27_9GLOM|nr:20182_t:CDS:1 [Cetraspora pellucida]